MKNAVPQAAKEEGRKRMARGEHKHVQPKVDLMTQNFSTPKYSRMQVACTPKRGCSYVPGC